MVLYEFGSLSVRTGLKHLFKCFMTALIKLHTIYKEKVISFFEYA